MVEEEYSFLDCNLALKEDRVLIEKNLKSYINYVRFRKLPKEIKFEYINECYIEENGFLKKPQIVISHNDIESRISFNKTNIIGSGSKEAKEFIESLSEKTEFSRGNAVKEYKRTCRNCSTVWHISVEESKKLEELSKTNSILGGITALSGNLTASAQATRNKDAHKEKLREQKKCPECGSQNFDEEVVTYDKG